MFSRFRDGYFAIGLIVGISLTLLLSVSVHSTGYKYSGEAKQVENRGGDGYANDKKNAENHNTFAYWVRRMVSLEDTAAQWLMTVFSAAAAGLLWRTLIITQGMALDARRVGEAQVRAYVAIVNASISRAGGGQIHLEITLKNSGNSPARNVLVRYGIPADDLQVGDIPIATLGPDADRRILAGEISAGTESKESLIFESTDIVFPEGEHVAFACRIKIEFATVFQTLGRQFCPFTAFCIFPVRALETGSAFPVKILSQNSEDENE